MTSLQFLHHPEPTAYDPPEWGTGKPKNSISAALPRNPTWRYTGDPVTQWYDVHKLQRSNVRLNDELVPKPQSIQIGRDCIDRPFPAEHPYASHIPHFAVFPKFDSAEDRKRGAAARSERPISSEMPANPYKVYVAEKVKGFPYRHEFQDVPKDSEREPLFWPGEDFFDQPCKVKGGQARYYPIPPKSMCPNLPERDATMRVCPRTANALRNVERQQWVTSQQRHYTGVGPSQPLVLDNLQDKQHKLVMTGLEDDRLYPHSQNEFHPPRAPDNRLMRMTVTLPLKAKSCTKDSTYQSSYNRKMTLTEREEHRLLYGTEYLNLPDTSDDPGRDVTWRDLDTASRAGPCLEKVEAAKAQITQTADTCPEASPRSPREDESYLTKAKVVKDQAVEELEAQNRWKVLEAQGPAQQRVALNHKMDVLHPKEKPVVFYTHQGRYNEQRAGLYKTSYDPHCLPAAINPDLDATSEDMNTLHSNSQAQQTVSLPAARLNEDVNAALKWSRTFSQAKPELSGDRQDAREVIQTYKLLKNRQARVLHPPAPHEASTRVQEGELVEGRDTTMGSSYNTSKFLQNNALHPGARKEPLLLMSQQNQSLHRKFLQNNALHPGARKEPLLLMSQQNQSLHRIRRPPSSPPQPTQPKAVQFHPDVQVASVSLPCSPRTMVETVPLAQPEDPPSQLAPPLEREISVPAPPVYSALPPLFRPDSRQADPAEPLRHSAPPSASGRRVRFADDVNNNRLDRDDAGEMVDERCAASFPKRMPGGLHGHGVTDSEYSHRYQVPRHQPHAVSHTQVFDLGFKDDDPFFHFEPGKGLPRNQSQLNAMQQSFNKSEIRRKFHETFPENGPDLRDNIVRGRRRRFWGYGSHVLHG